MHWAAEGTGARTWQVKGLPGSCCPWRATLIVHRPLPMGLKWQVYVPSPRSVSLARHLVPWPVRRMLTEKPSPPVVCTSPLSLRASMVNVAALPAHAFVKPSPWMVHAPATVELATFRGAARSEESLMRQAASAAAATASNSTAARMTPHTHVREEVSD